MNSLFNALGPFNNIQKVMSQVNQLKRSFNGDPRQAINQMLQSGRINQRQVDQAKQMAEQIQSMLR